MNASSFDCPPQAFSQTIGMQQPNDSALAPLPTGIYLLIGQLRDARCGRSPLNPLSPRTGRGEAGNRVIAC